MKSSTLLNRLAVTVLLFVNGRMFVHRLKSSKMNTFKMDYCCLPFIFVVNGTVTRSTRPVVDCGFNAKDAREIHSTLHISIFTTLIYKIVSATTFVLFPRLLIKLFLHVSGATTHVTVRKFPCCNAKFVFFVLGLSVVKCCRDVRRMGPTVAFTILHKLIFLIPYFVTLPTVVKMGKV